MCSKWEEQGVCALNGRDRVCMCALNGRDRVCVL